MPAKLVAKVVKRNWVRASECVKMVKGGKKGVGRVYFPPDFFQEQIEKEIKRTLLYASSSSKESS